MLKLKEFSIDDDVELDVETTVNVYTANNNWLVHCKVDTGIEYCGSNNPDDNDQQRTYDCEISKVELVDEDGVVISNITDTIPALLLLALALKIEQKAAQSDEYWSHQSDYYESLLGD